MSKRPFSKTRRRLLQSSAAALASAPVVGLTDGDLASCAQQPAERPVCIRSPWVNYSLRTVTMIGQGEYMDGGNEEFPTLVATTMDAGQWLENPDWWTGNGTDRALYSPWDSDPSRLGSVALPGRSACLIGVQLEKTIATASNESLLLIGRTLPAGSGVGLQLKLNVGGKPRVTLWDDAGNTVSLTGRSVVTATNGGRCTLFIYLDHRLQGSRTMSLHTFETGTAVQSSSVLSTHTLGAITGADSPDNGVLVGARRLPSGSLDQFYVGSLRGVTILNFGTTPPANMSGIMESLSTGDMEPGDPMQGV